MQHPVFQVMFDLISLNENNRLAPFMLGQAGSKVSLGAFEIESLAYQHKALEVNLHLQVAEVENDIFATIRYNADCFDPETIVRLSDHYQKILHIISEKPDLMLQDFYIVTDKEKDRIFNDFNKYRFQLTLLECTMIYCL